MRLAWSRTQLVMALLALGCGEGPDTTPPAVVDDLAVASVTESTATLAWTAPGDDGSEGTASAYDLRYALEPVAGVWEQASRLDSLPPPRRAGSKETATIAGLLLGERYSVALRTEDQAGNLSGFSNLVWAEPGDGTAPAAVSDLRVAAVRSDRVTLFWTAPGDDVDTGQAARFELRYRVVDLSETSWDGATEVDGVLSPGPAGSHQSGEAVGLTAGTTYTFGLRTFDDAGNASPLSNLVPVTTPDTPRTWEVKEDGSGDAPTVQGAIDSARSGDVVLVYPGTYFEHVDFTGNNIHLKSASGPEVTILDGSRDLGSVVTIASGETRAAILEGFTITGGTGTHAAFGPLVGGGVFIQDASPTVRGNVISGNTLEDGTSTGGGLFLDTIRYDGPQITPLIVGNHFLDNHVGQNGGGCTIGGSHVEIMDNVFQGNTAAFDGGAMRVRMISGSLTLLNNEFIENIAQDHGGAIELVITRTSRTLPGRIEGNLFVRNRANGTDSRFDFGSGGAMSVRPFEGTISNNTFVDNIGTGKGNCTGGSILIDNHAYASVTNNIFANSRGCALDCRNPFNEIVFQDNIFWNNTPGHALDRTGACLPDDWESLNIFADPLFCDPANDDYRVQSDSPAITNGRQIGAFLTPGCGPP